MTSSIIRNSLMNPPPTLRLPPMPSVRDMVKLYRLQAMKHLSQNFIFDMNITGKIVRAAGKIRNHHVCEVGPGPGGITRSILQRDPKQLILIEKDRRFTSTLLPLMEAAPGKITPYWGDVLTFNLENMFPEEAKKDWDDVTPDIKIIGNLPFSISTPLISRWLSCISAKSNAWKFGRVPLLLTFQLEVGERMIAEEGESQRSRLSIMCQNWCITQHKFTIKGNAFIPKPDVDVAVMKFIPRKQPIINVPYPIVEKVVRNIFHNRGRYCYLGVRQLFPYPIRVKLTDEVFLMADVDRIIRSFDLTMEEIRRFCFAYKRVNKYKKCSNVINLNIDQYQLVLEGNPGVWEYEYRSHKPDDAWLIKYGHLYSNLDLSRTTIPIEEEEERIKTLSQEEDP